ncbi:hypothetical protein D477_002431 [Arthrobacter crystallopoietes BAB-32]|uniref:Uncharacterized protein n=1 Tax=Arthrobacter crystallopoietes BAB-32 TaxID=1246476 RepID=N1V3C0_9MICC|nr:hypothetical protein [Arthrobacter crystallopoietes]EMY35810.1 hypothetical protein D477_002431 [Arthrobacter crystallopoietes BAB-32]
MAVDLWERSGAELAERICARRDKHLVVISQRTDSDLLHLDATYVSDQLEEIADVVVVRGAATTIIHVFSSRLYGLRRYQSRINRDAETGGLDS